MFHVKHCLTPCSDRRAWNDQNMARIFITSRNSRDDAWATAGAYAAQLRAQGLTETHGIDVEYRRTGPRGHHTYWVVLVVDEPEDTTEE